MKVSVCFVALVLTWATVSVQAYGGSSGGGGYGGSSSGGGGYGGGGGGGESVAAPPCPKNYMFSCQPKLSPVACAAASSGGYGSSGAYSENVPTVLTAPYGYPIMPQNFYPVPNYYANY